MMPGQFRDYIFENRIQVTPTVLIDRTKSWAACAKFATQGRIQGYGTTPEEALGDLLANNAFLPRLQDSQQ